MNLELNVVRFENEDVIATSGVCANIEAEPSNGQDFVWGGHIKVTSYSNGFVLAPSYNYDNGSKSLVSTGGGYMLNSTNDYQETTNIDSLGWYHFDKVAGKYVKCTDQSSEAHPIAE